MKKILLVEDDPVLGRGLCVNLELEKYQIEWAKDLKTATELALQAQPDLIILDLNLPDGSGLSLLRMLRQIGKNFPIIILTAKTDEDSVVEGLQTGANDYVRKPFGNKELLARIKIALREIQSSNNIISYAGITLYKDQRRITFNQKNIELNRREFDILGYMIQHAELVISRESLMNAIQVEDSIFDRTIDSHVCHIRNRLRKAEVEAIQILSVYGIGYRLEKK